MSDDLLSQHVQEAVDAGRTPDQIVTSFKNNVPGAGPMVDEALKAGKTPEQLVDKLKTLKYSDFQPPAPSSGIVDQLRHGAASYIQGLSNTAKQTVGPDANTAAADSAASTIQPNKYVAPQFDWHHPIDTAGEIPKVIASDAPGWSGDLAAGWLGATVGSAIPGIGTTIGGLVGAGAHAWARMYGDKVAQAMQADNNTTGQSTPGEKARASASSIISGLATRVGLKGATGTLAQAGEDLGSSALQSAALGVSKSLQEGAKVAALSAGQTAADTGLIEKRLPTVDEAMNSAAVGGAVGTGIRAGRILRDVRAPTLGGNDLESPNEVKARLAAKYATARIDPLTGEDVNTAAGDELARQRVESDLGSHLKTANQQIKPQLAALEADDPTDTTRATLDRVNDRLSKNLLPDPTDYNQLHRAIGESKEGENLLNLMQEQYTHNKLSSQGASTKSGEFIGGVDSTHPIQDYATLGGSGTRYWATHAGVYGAIHGLTGLTHAAELAGMAATAKLGARGLDAITGLRRPLDDFIQRNNTGNHGIDPSLVSFRQNQADVEKQAALDDAASKDMASTQKQAESENKARDKSAVQAEKEKQAADDDYVQKLLQASKATAKAVKRPQSANSLPEVYQNILGDKPEVKAPPLTYGQKPSADIPGMTNQDVADLLRSKKQVDMLDAIKARSATPDPMEGWAQEQARRLQLMRSSNALEMQQARANAATEGTQLDQYGQPTSTSTGPNLRASKLASALEAAREGGAVETPSAVSKLASKLTAHGKAVDPIDRANQGVVHQRLAQAAKEAKAAGRAAKVKAAASGGKSSHHTTGGADKSHGSPKAPHSGSITVQSPAGHSVKRSLEKVENPEAYQHQVQHNLNERHRVISDIASSQPKTAHAALHDLNVRMDTTGPETHQGHIDTAMKHIVGNQTIRKVVRARLEGLLKLNHK